MKVPSMWQIIQVDDGVRGIIASAFPTALFSLIYGLVIRFFEYELISDPELIVAFVLISTLSLPFALMRIYVIRSTFRKGDKLDGTITKAKPVLFSFNAIFVEYSFFWKDELQTGRMTVNGHKWLQDLQEGNLVTVVIDPKRPRHVFLEVVYSQ